MPKYLLSFALVLLFAQAIGAQTDQASQPRDSSTSDRSFILTDPQEVLKHDDELVTVEGCVVRASLKAQVKGKPIFLDLFTAYPDNILTVAIWEEDQSKFLAATEYNQKMVRITGKAKKKTFTPPGKAPQERVTISLHDPKQISVLGECRE